MDREDAHAWIAARGEGLRDLACVMAALSLGLPDALAPPCDLPGLCERLSLPESRLGPLVDALCWMGLLQDSGGMLWSTPLGQRLLTDRALRPQLASAGLGAEAWLALATTVHTGQAQPMPRWPCWATEPVPQPLQDRTTALARQLMALLPLDVDAPVHFVDLGSGKGIHARAFLEGFPQSRVTCLDRGPILEAARAELADAGLLHRATLRPAELLTEDPSMAEMADVALVSDVLHSYGPTASLQILQGAVSMLRPGGLLVVKDLLVDRTGQLPRVGNDFSLHMMVHGMKGRAHSPAQVRGWMEAAGVEGVRPLAGFPPSLGCFAWLAWRGPGRRLASGS